MIQAYKRVFAPSWKYIDRSWRPTRSLVADSSRTSWAGNVKIWNSVKRRWFTLEENRDFEKKSESLID